MCNQTQQKYEFIKNTHNICSKHILHRPFLTKSSLHHSQKHLLINCAFSVENIRTAALKVRIGRSEIHTRSLEYQNVIQHWQSNRLLRAFYMTATSSAKFVDCIGKEMLTDPNTGKYCPGNNLSDFRISGPKHRISHDQ